MYVQIMTQPVSGMIAVPLDCLPLMLFGLTAGPPSSVSLLGVATGSSGSSLTPSKKMQEVKLVVVIIPKDITYLLCTSCDGSCIFLRTVAIGLRIRSVTF